MNEFNDLIYRLQKNLEYECIATNNHYLQALYDKSTKYYKLPQNTSSVKFIACQPIGNFTLYLLAELESEIKNIPKAENIQQFSLFREYLIKAINNDEYCDNRIFLSFIDNIVGTSSLPKCDYFTSNYYSDIQLDNNICDETTSKRLEAIHSNAENIMLNKDYYCNNLVEILISSLFEIFSKGYVIKKCRSCDRFFVARQSTIFCPYASPKNESLSCFDYSRNTSYVEKRAKDPIRDKYNKVANMLRKRKNDASLFHEDLYDRYNNDYTNFTDEYVQVLKPQHSRGEITQDEFLNLLKEKEVYYKYKYKEGDKNGSSGTNKK